MAAEMLDKLDAVLDLLPKFEVAIGAGRDDEVGLCAHKVRDHISMHIALLVALGVRQILQIQFLVRQDLKNIHHSKMVRFAT